MDVLNAILQASDLVAVLGREIQVKLTDISASGCRIESDSRLAVGTTGALRVTYGGVEYADDVRIMRCGESAGAAGGFVLGAEFLWTSTPGERSLRRLLATIPASAIQGASLGATERM